MRDAQRRALLTQLLGTLCYLGGLTLFLVTGLDIYFSEPEGSFSGITTSHTIMLGLSLALLILGGVIMQRSGISFTGASGFGIFPGRTQVNQKPGPEQSPLEELGYHIPPEESETDAEPEPPDDESVRCSHCGALNEKGYRFCGECSREL